MSLTKLSLTGEKNLFPARVVTSRLGMGKSITFFTVYLGKIAILQLKLTLEEKYIYIL